MDTNIERLLKLAADYQNFRDEIDNGATQSDPGELSEEDLFLVAAAAKMPERKNLEDCGSGFSGKLTKG